MEDIAIVALAQTKSYRRFPDSEPALLMGLVNQVLAETGLERREVDFTIAGSCDYLSGMPFAFISNVDAFGAWPPVYESHVEMDGAWALFEGFVRYLAARIAEQQQVIANLVTVDSEQRLGQTLLHLADTLGKKNQQSTRVELKISHDELSEMVGTTRPRISLFMQRFRNLGLIEPNREHVLIIHENKLTDYLAQIA